MESDAEDEDESTKQNHRRDLRKGMSLRNLKRQMTTSLSSLYEADITARGDGDDEVLAPEGVERFRQLFAIRIIERHYTRHVRVRPAQLFVDAERTRQAEWGKLTFATRQALVSSRMKQGYAYYMRVSHNSEAGRVARCIAKYWHVAKPSVLIAVTGGARSLAVTASDRKAFCEGLVAAARATGAIIFTGGTATGVMSLVGDALSMQGSGPPIPCIGFVSWPKVLGAALLANNHGEAEPRKYAAGADASNEGAALEPRHTHFVLADHPAGGWGSEIRLREGVLQLLGEWFKVPGVLLVLGGGVNTLRTVVEAIIISARPVVLVEDSGGAADAIAYYHHGWSAETGASDFDLGGFEGGSWSSAEEQIRTICEAGEPLGLLFPIKLSGPDAESIDAAILRAIVNKQRASQNSDAGAAHKDCAARLYRKMQSFFGEMPPQQTDYALASGDHHPTTPMPAGTPGQVNTSRLRLNKSLKLAVQWDRVDVLEDILEERQKETNQMYEGFGAMRGMRSVDESAIAWDLQAALQLSLELHKPSAVELLLAHRASLGKVNLCVLWAARHGDLLGLFSKSTSLSELRSLPRDLRQLTHEQQIEHLSTYVVPFLDELMAPLSYSAALSQRVASRETSTANADDEPSPPLTACGRGRKRPTSDQPSGGDQPRCDDHQPVDLEASDTFFWAVASGSWDLAHTLWSATKDPLRNALIAFGMCNRMAASSEEHAEVLLNIALGFEARAMTILAALPTDVATDPAQGVLLTSTGAAFVGGGRDLIMLAHLVEAKRFMTLPHVRKVTRDLEHSSRTLALPNHFGIADMLLTCVPFTGRLDECVDLAEAEWRRQKRKLSLGDQRRQQLKPRSQLVKFGEFLRIPRVKIALRAFLYIIFLLNFIGLFVFLVEITEPCRRDEFTYLPLLQGVVAFWTVSLLVDELWQGIDDYTEYFLSPWNWLDLSSIGLIGVALVLLYTDDSCSKHAADVAASGGRVLKGVSGDTGVAGVSLEELQKAAEDAAIFLTYNRVVMLLGSAAIPCFVRLLHMFVHHKRMGVLIIIIAKTFINDVLIFFALLGAFLVGFALTFVAILRTQTAHGTYLSLQSAARQHVPPGLWAYSADGRTDIDPSEIKPGDIPITGGVVWTLVSAFGLPLWATVGENQMDAMAASSPFWGLGLLWIFVLVAQVLLVNLLIAMMGSTYSTYIDKAEEEYFFNRVRTLMEHRDYLPVPPPFGLLLLPVTLVSPGFYKYFFGHSMPVPSCLKACCRCCARPCGDCCCKSHEPPTPDAGRKSGRLTGKWISGRLPTAGASDRYARLSDEGEDAREAGVSPMQAALAASQQALAADEVHSAILRVHGTHAAGASSAHAHGQPAPNGYGPPPTTNHSGVHDGANAGPISTRLERLEEHASTERAMMEDLQRDVQKILYQQSQLLAVVNPQALELPTQRRRKNQARTNLVAVAKVASPLMRRRSSADRAPEGPSSGGGAGSGAACDVPAPPVVQEGGCGPTHLPPRRLAHVAFAVAPEAVAQPEAAAPPLARPSMAAVFPPMPTPRGATDWPNGDGGVDGTGGRGRTLQPSVRRVEVLARRPGASGDLPPPTALPPPSHVPPWDATPRGHELDTSRSVGSEPGIGPSAPNANGARHGKPQVRACKPRARIVTREAHAEPDLPSWSGGGGSAGAPPTAATRVQTDAAMAASLVRNYRANAGD